MNARLIPALCVSLLVMPMVVTAAVWRVDSIPGHPADFTTVTAAINSAQVQDGDTLVLQGDFTTEATSLNRKLHLVGYGFYHAENGYHYPVGTILEARLGDVTIGPGATTRADGTSITGCVTGVITITDAANILIRRNKITQVHLSGVGGQAARGITIAQNYFLSRGASNERTIYCLGGHAVGDVLIVGNYIPRTPYGGSVSILSDADDSLTVLNNVLQTVSLGGYGAFQNNYVVDSSLFLSTWITVRNNMSLGLVTLPTGNGNVNAVAQADVFVLTSSPDGKYQLKANSPALGAGADGYDIGMFSGPMPYILSGLPPVPLITQLQLPPVVEDGQDVPVTIRAEVKQ